MLSRPSSTVNIYLKPKTDKLYLKELCNKLKIPRTHQNKLKPSKVFNFTKTKTLEENSKINLHCLKMYETRNIISPFKHRKTKNKFKKQKTKKFKVSYNNNGLLYKTYSYEHYNRNKNGFYTLNTKINISFK